MLKEVHLQTDVLIVGGGVAGLNAAVTAAKAGLSVVVTDKGYIEHSGNISGGVDHFLAYLETGPTWDTKEAYLQFTGNSARGATDLKVVEAVYCEELKTAIQYSTDIGCPLHRPGGSYFRTKSYGQPGPWWINFNGKRMKPLLGQAVRKAGCRVLDRVVVTDLLVHEGEVCGGVGFHLRDGVFHVISAKAVVVTTGGTNRLYQNPSGLNFNTWMSPVNTGDGAAMAFRAGATLANIEYLRMSVVPRGLNAAGLNALVGMGAIFINARGDAFMESYDPLGMNAPRFKLVEGVLGEIKANRGPVYADCRHLDPDGLRHLITTLSYDKDTLPEFFEQKGIDLKRDLLEIYPSDGMQGGPNEVCGSGVKIGPDCSSTVPGLYAAGNGSDQCRSLHMAVTSGIHAGRHASAYVQKKRQIAPVPEKDVQKLRDDLYVPLTENKNRSISWQEYEDVLQRVVTEGLGPVRSEATLKLTGERLDEMEQWFEKTKAVNYHELCRLLENKSKLTVAKAMMKAALMRTESRFGLCHFRSDFPETDEAWTGQILVKKGQDGQIKTSFLSL